MVLAAVPPFFLSIFLCDLPFRNLRNDSLNDFLSDFLRDIGLSSALAMSENRLIKYGFIHLTYFHLSKIYIAINIVIITLCIQCTFRRDDVILEAIINYQTMSSSCSHQIPFMAVACNQDKIIVECKVIIMGIKCIQPQYL